MKITNDCLQEDQPLFIEVGDICHPLTDFTGGGIGGADIKVILNALYIYQMQNKECCETTQKMLNEIFNRLIKYEELYYQMAQLTKYVLAINKLVETSIQLQKECCKTDCGCYSCSKTSIAGQAINTIELEAITDNRRLPAKKNQLLQKAETRRESPNNELGDFYRNYTDYKITNNQVLDSSGQDIAKYMPWNLNMDLGDNSILECVNCYRVLPNSYLKGKNDVVFTFQTRNLDNGTAKINEMTAFAYKKYF